MQAINEADVDIIGDMNLSIPAVLISMVILKPRRRLNFNWSYGKPGVQSPNILPLLVASKEDGL